MYTIVEVPQSKHKDCQGCPHHSRQLVKSGKNPIREHNCNHPRFINFLNMGLLKRDGRNIGQDSKTPSWCPFLTKNDKRGFAEITSSEALKCCRILKLGIIQDEKDWDVEKADTSIYKSGGLRVFSPNNDYEFIFDFELEMVHIFNEVTPEGAEVSTQSSYMFVRYLNSQKIFFSWQPEKYNQ